MLSRKKSYINVGILQQKPCEYLMLRYKSLLIRILHYVSY